MSNFRLTAKLAQVRTPRLAAKASGASRKNYELIFQPFNIPYGFGARASQAIAYYSIPLEQRWSLRVPIRPPSTNFVAVVAYRFGPVVRRYKLWKNVGEVADFPLYLGETVESDARIEIWTVPNRSAVLPFVWKLPLTLLELPKTPADKDGTDIVAQACVVPYPADVDTLFTACAY